MKNKTRPKLVNNGNHQCLLVQFLNRNCGKCLSQLSPDYLLVYHSEYQIIQSYYDGCTVQTLLDFFHSWWFALPVLRITTSSLLFFRLLNAAGMLYYLVSIFGCKGWTQQNHSTFSSQTDYLLYQVRLFYSIYSWFW